MDTVRALGLNVGPGDSKQERDKLHLYINLKLSSSGQPACLAADGGHFMATAQDLLKSYREKNRLLAGHLCPADRRIQDFLERYLADLQLESVPRLPSMTFVLDRHGVARELSLPMGGDEFRSDIVSSYRIKPVPARPA